MTIYDINNGNQTDATKAMANWNESLKFNLKNHVRDLINNAGVYSADETDLYGEAYIDADGRNNSVDTTDTKAEFSTNKYQVPTLPTGTEPYVIIEATSLTVGNFAINDCVCTPIAEGKWVLYCTVGTDEVMRAKIYATLFYGDSSTSGNSGKVTGITGLTALKTSVSRDVDKRGYYMKAEVSGTPNIVQSAFVLAKGSATFTENASDTTLTFNNTTDNNDCSSWSYLADTAGSPVLSWQIPSGTTRNSADNTTSNEIATDLSGDETDNPANCKIAITVTSYNTGRVTTDFYTDNSIPDFTAAGTIASDLDTFIEHDIPSGTFSSTISSAILSPIVEDWETGASIQYKLTNATEDTGWLPIDEVSNFTAFTSEPTKCIVRLNPKSTSPTANYPSIRGCAYRCG